jgi:hypothetical protein
MFRRNYGFHFQVQSDYSHEDVEVYSSETLVTFYRTARWYISEDRSLRSDVECCDTRDASLACARRSSRCNNSTGYAHACGGPTVRVNTLKEFYMGDIELTRKLLKWISE